MITGEARTLLWFQVDNHKVPRAHSGKLRRNLGPEGGVGVCQLLYSPSPGGIPLQSCAPDVLLAGGGPQKTGKLS